MSVEDRVFECENCGGAFEKISEGKYKCKYCGFVKEILTSTSGEILSLLNDANRLRRNGDFDEAYDIYQTITQKDPNNPEGYWGLFLSEYGIYHEEDPKTKRHVPTCHRISTISVFDNNNLKKTLELASDNQREAFRQSAEEIENIREKIVKIAQNEPPYDVFICYKRTINNTNGEESYTKDSVNAQKIYTKLTSLGYKVFFAENTLQNLAGTEYEPIIFNALNTSRIMFVICSKPEYINSTWVKNEWRRYLNIMQYDETKRIIPVLQDMPGSKLPDLLKKHQALEINVDFESNLLSTVTRILGSANKANVQRVSIDQKKATKKSNTLKSNIEAREIKFNSATKLVVSDQTQIRNALLSLKNRAYDMAIDDFLMLKNKESLKNICEFALTFIRFQLLNRNMPERLVGKTIDDLGNKGLSKYLSKTTNIGQPVARLSEKEGNDLIKTFNACVENCDKETSDFVFSEMKKEYTDSADLVTKSYIYVAISGWESSIKNDLFTNANFIILTTANLQCKPIYDVVAKCYDSQDVDGYINLLQEYAKCFMKNSSFTMAIDAYNKILEVDDGNVNARYNKFLAELKVRSEADLKWVVYKLDENMLTKFKDEVLSYCNEQQRYDYLSSFADKLTYVVYFIYPEYRILQKDFLSYALNISNLKKSNRDVCEKAINLLGTDGKITYKITETNYYKMQKEQAKKQEQAVDGLINAKRITKRILALQNSDGAENGKEDNLFVDWSLKNLLKCFDTILSYYPQDKDTNMVTRIRQMADSLKRNRFFEQAVKYYRIIISANKDAHDCYWGILQCKLKCADSDELVYAETPLKNMQEFQDAINSAPDQYTVEKYQKVYNEQRSSKKSHAPKPTRKMPVNPGKIDFNVLNKKDKDETTLSYLKTRHRHKVTQIVALIILLVAGLIAGGYYLDSFLYYNVSHYRTTYITTKDEFLAIGNSGKYTLTIDIDLNHVDKERFARKNSDVFNGIIFGDGHKIFNYKLDVSDNNANALFGNASGAKFCNLEMVDVQITQSKSGMQTYIGALVSKGENVTIQNVTISGTIEGIGLSCVGSLAGMLTNGSVVKDCISTCTISGNKMIGGLVGYLNGSAINLTNEGDLTATAEYSTGNVIDLGGICGVLYGKGHNLVNKGNITYKRYSTLKYTGGVIGFCGAYLTDISNSGNVIGDCFVGGCVGGLYSGNVIPDDGMGETTSVTASLNGAKNTGTVKALGSIVGDNNGNDISCGGIAGYVCKANFINAENRGDIVLTDTGCKSGRYIGGIVGDFYSRDYETTYIRLHNYGKILLSSKQTYKQVGGIIGHMFEANYVVITFQNCSNNVALGQETTISTDVGGIIGYFQGTNKTDLSRLDFINCSQTGNISGIKYAGGLAGDVSAGGHIEKNCTYNGYTYTNGTQSQYGTPLLGNVHATTSW